MVIRKMRLIVLPGDGWESTFLYDGFSYRMPKSFKEWLENGVFKKHCHGIYEQSTNVKTNKTNKNHNMLHLIEKNSSERRWLFHNNFSHYFSRLGYDPINWATFSIKSIHVCKSMPKSMKVHSMPSLWYSSCSSTNMWWLKNCCNFSFVKLMHNCSKPLNCGINVSGIVWLFRVQITLS